jgi:hypothetical protein
MHLPGEGDQVGARRTCVEVERGVVAQRAAGGQLRQARLVGRVRDGQAARVHHRALRSVRAACAAAPRPLMVQCRYCTAPCTPSVPECEYAARVARSCKPVRSRGVSCADIGWPLTPRIPTIKQRAEQVGGSCLHMADSLMGVGAALQHILHGHGRDEHWHATPSTPIREARHGRRASAGTHP